MEELTTMSSNSRLDHTITTAGTIMATTTNHSSAFDHNTGPQEVDLGKFWIGVGLSVSSSVFIGASFIIKKKALLRLSKGGKRANQGGHGYLRDYLWWAGFLSMALGEAANFIAYAFAPASLVSTLGVLSVLVSTILASRLLKERLNFLGKMGCFLCAIGSTIIVIHAPKENDIVSMADLQEKIIDPMFIVYVLFVIAVSLILIYHCRPKNSETATKTLLIWIGVCAMIGSLSVMFCKGFGLAFTTTFGNGPNEFTNWLTWLCLVALIMCITVQMNFLNKALDTFNTALVTPIYYVFFTTCVISASAILFREFAHLSVNDWLGLFCGFSTVLTAIVLLHFCKSYDITLEKMAQQIKVTQDEEVAEFHESVSIAMSGDGDTSGDRDIITKSGQYGALKETIDHENEPFALT